MIGCEHHETMQCPLCARDEEVDALYERLERLENEHSRAAEHAEAHDARIRAETRAETVRDVVERICTWLRLGPDRLCPLNSHRLAASIEYFMKEPADLPETEKGAKR